MIFERFGTCGIGNGAAYREHSEKRRRDYGYRRIMPKARILGSSARKGTV